MAFTLPTFVVPTSVWRFSNWNGTIPPVAAADLFPIGNLVPGRRLYGNFIERVSYLLYPVTTDVRFTEGGIFAAIPSADPDLIEVPTGSGRYYEVLDVESVGLLFANEHIEVAIQKMSPWAGGVIPPPPPPPVESFVQSAHNSVSLTGSISQAFVNPVTAGDLLYVAVVSEGAPVTSVTSLQSGALTLLNTTVTGGGATLYTYYKQNCSAGVDSITASLMGFGNVVLAITEFAGAAAVSALVASGSVGGNSASPSSGPTFTAGISCIQITSVGFGSGLSNSAPAISVPFALALTVPNILGTVPGVAIGFTVNDTASETPVYTLGTADFWACDWTTFRP